MLHWKQIINITIFFVKQTKKKKKKTAQTFKKIKLLLDTYILVASNAL